MSVYAVYGLRLRSNRPLSGLVRAEGDEVDLDLDLEGCWPAEVPAMAQVAWTQTYPLDRDNAAAVVVWKLATDAGTYTHVQYETQAGRVGFVIDPAACRLWAVWSGAMTFGDVEAFLVGLGLGAVLRLRGQVCLHASVVGRGDRAAALIGPNGRGKSTMAAILASHDFRVLADDIAVLADQDGRIWVQPGYPRLRVTPATAGLVHVAPDQLVSVLSYDVKRYLELSLAGESQQGRFDPRPLPLAAVYYLSRRNPPAMEPAIHFVPYQQRMTVLGQHIYADYLGDRAMRIREFAMLGRLVDTVPVRRLSRPNRLEAMPKAGALLAADFESGSLA